MSSDKNDFFSRGCNKSPKSYQKNDDLFCHECCKLDITDWLKDFESPNRQNWNNYVEIRFKNSRKEFFQAPPELNLQAGDIVAVEASPGHDIGIVSITGELVLLQLKKKNIILQKEIFKKVYRRAKPSDIEKWVAAVEIENTNMYKARKMAAELNLDMKINDIEYQGDKTKAIFYYTADERVDFRELIKVLAEKFMVRIEMKQIGARQEASRLGGIGSCGRELCCSTFLTNFKSVSTSVVRSQQLSLNPQKLAGQCGKLKCCLNYECDYYVEALSEFPDSNIILKTEKGRARHQKTDVFNQIMYYTYEGDEVNFIPLSVENVEKIIELNKKNNFPARLEEFIEGPKEEVTFENVVGQDDVTRFDNKEPFKRKKRKKRKRKTQ